MDIFRQHIFFKILTLTLMLTFLLPAAVKILHVFEQHKHEVCLGEADTHIHTKDVECEFYKFKLNTPFTIPENHIATLVSPQIEGIIPTNYAFLSEFQYLHFSLRGPPAISLI
ncbi:hypothetical protein [Gelidibacter sediminis]|nr:hypothetical protein [Gelidibacter sediminis]